MRVVAVEDEATARKPFSDTVKGAPRLPRVPDEENDAKNSRATASAIPVSRGGEASARSQGQWRAQCCYPKATPPRWRVTAELTTPLSDPKCRPQIGGQAEITKRRDYAGPWDTLGAAPV